MVEFTNIKIKDGYIYADAYDVSKSVKRSIKVSCTGEDYYIEGSFKDNCQIIKAFWSLQRRLSKNRKLNSEETICWG